jgi:hypothetical protein
VYRIISGILKKNKLKYKRGENKMLEGKTIIIIKPLGGLFTRQPKHFEIWTQDGVLIITEPKHIIAIQKAIKEAKKQKININEYIKNKIDQEEILKYKEV